MQVTMRVSPCRALPSGVDSDECRPAPDIVAPLVGSAAALERMGKAALQNPDSAACAHVWVPVTITTDGYKRFKEGDTFAIAYQGERKLGVIWSAPRIEQVGIAPVGQSFTVQIYIPNK